MVRPTLERIYIENVGFYGQETVDRHLKRYRWAMKYLDRGDTVLDACCGSGYGSMMMARRCLSVLGIDKSAEAIGYAAKNYRRKNLSFKTSDLSGTLRFSDEAEFDAVTWIEAIEHFTVDQARVLLHAFKKKLYHNGRLLITTPDKIMSSKKNRYHVHEYTMTELCDLVSSEFDVLEGDRVGKFIYLVAENAGDN